MNATARRIEQILLLDVGPALACFAVGTLPLMLDGTSQNSPLVTVGLGAGLVAPLLLRRRLPVLALCGVAAVLAFFELYGVLVTTFVSNAGPALAVAVYTLASRRERRPALYWSAGVSLVLAVLTRLAVHVDPFVDHDAVQLVLAAVGFVVGDVVRSRRVDRLELTRQQQRQAEEREARIRAEERLRVSRDVHDVVSHTLSTVAVRAGVARVVLDRDPDEVRTALSAIETASREALEELRTVLRATRTPGADGPAEPGLEDLPALADTVRSTGTDVRLEVRARRYPPLVETTVYRVVQEGLTNVVKHARAARVDVVVADRTGAVEVIVRDDGHGSTSGAPGVGLAGMRERVELIGGTVSAGAVAGGGFEVVARIPAADRG